jgi:hypothetical protein
MRPPDPQNSYAVETLLAGFTARAIAAALNARHCERARRRVALDVGATASACDRPGRFES